MSILSIEGLGGIGKTSLFNYAKSCSNFKAMKYLELNVGGANFKIEDGIIKVLRELISSAKYFDKATKKLEKIDSKFIETKELIAAYHELFNDISLEDKKTESNGDKMNLSRLYFEILKPMGEGLNKISPVTRKYFDASSLPMDEKVLTDIFNGIQSINISAPSILEQLGIQTKTSKLKNSIQRNILDAIADSLYDDITTVLYKYQDASWYSPKPSKNENTDRLLFLIDDFEYSGQLVRILLTDHLLPKLKQAPFESLVVIIGRDQIENTSPTWNRNLAANILKPVRLKFLKKDELMELIENSVGDLDDHQALHSLAESAWMQTGGHPLLVQVWMDELQDGEISAAALKRFYDRVTQWMSDSQKEWLNHCIFCDSISVDFFKKNFKISEDEAKAALAWFESEGSIRDNSSPTLQVNNFVRSRISSYLKLTSPGLFSKLESKYVGGENARSTEESA